MFAKKSATCAALNSAPRRPRRCHPQPQPQPHRALSSPRCTSPYSPCPRARFYSTADTSGDKRASGPPHPVWPRKAKPSPYDIFGIRPKEPYSKSRYYQLVKLYHPDIQAGGGGGDESSSSSSVSPAVRLERYRLVVAANAILSDPAKRRSYDVHGIGWHMHDGSHAGVRQADRDWRHRPGSAAMNATWEDWERWRREQEGGGSGSGGGSKKQDPLFMSNALFASLIGAAGVIGALAMEKGAESTGSHFVEVQAVRNHAVGQQMRYNAMASAGLSQDERVHRFLKDRENVEFAFSPGKYEQRHDADDDK